MGWIRSVGSIKLQVSFAEYILFYRALLQKRPITLSILLTEATPYLHRPLMCERGKWMKHTRTQTRTTHSTLHIHSPRTLSSVSTVVNVRGRQVDDTHTHTHTTHSTLHNILHIRGLDSPFSTYVECVVCVCVCVIHLPPTFSTYVECVWRVECVVCVCVCVIHLPPTFSTYVECVWRVEGHSILHTHSPHTFSTHILHIRGLDSPHSTLHTHTLSRVSTVKV